MGSADIWDALCCSHTLEVNRGLDCFSTPPSLFFLFNMFCKIMYAELAKVMVNANYDNLFGAYEWLHFYSTAFL